MSEYFEQADEICRALVDRPDDKELKNELVDTISYIQLGLKPICTQLHTVLTLLQEYHETLPSQAQKLRDIVDMAMDDCAADTKKIQVLMADVGEAKVEISRLSAAIVGLGIAVGGSVLLSILSFAAAGPWGALSLIFTSAAIVAASTFIVIDSQKIKALREKIQVDQQDMDEYTSDVAQLQIMSSAYYDLAKKALEMEECINFISGAWEAMQTDLKEIKKELSTATKRIPSKDWENIRRDFNVAAAQWIDFITKAKLLKVNNLKGCDSKLGLGMTPEEVKAAVKNGREIDLLEYLTA